LLAPVAWRTVSVLCCWFCSVGCVARRSDLRCAQQFGYCSCFLLSAARCAGLVARVDFC
ncbi:hypothetical protein A2U01_0073541, partial [Trifolium medium]|nr:hypothetical protein [Trifolium medium]